MIVKCISNSPNKAIETHKYTGNSTGTNDDMYPLTIDREYRVYAIFFLPNKGVLYLILDDSVPNEVEIVRGYGAPDPISYDSSLFQVVEGADDDWVRFSGTPFTKKGTTVSFADFAHKSLSYYEDLLNEDEDAIAAFKREVIKGLYK